MGLDNLLELVEGIKDSGLRSVVKDIISNPRLTFTDAKPIISIDESPAAPRKHHFFTGGLLIHTYMVTLISRKIADAIKHTYGLDIDEDLILATAILHDIFKYYQYTPDNLSGGYKVREDWYLPHDYAIIAELAIRDAPDKLIRAISEVHGQSPFTTIEGLIVHLADSLDAKLGELLQNILIFKVKEFEKKCSPYRIIDELMKKHGVKQIIQLAFKNHSVLKNLAERVCNEISLDT
ncbi:MAG: HD domain-containing protein [Desulfurococcaceae archaeon]